MIFYAVTFHFGFSKVQFFIKVKNLSGLFMNILKIQNSANQY